jgi:hypothetical protein
VKTGRNHDKAAHVESRRSFYDWLATEVRIPGIVAAERDTNFDDEKLLSAGIRLVYPTTLGSLKGVKSGVLLEVGFDDTTPNRPVTISSWAYDTAVARGVSVMDNRALDVLCYEPSHTFVEKLQTLSTKYRGLPETGHLPPNFLRHYYDVYCLLAQPDVLAFIGTPAYEARKRQRFRAADELVIARNPAFVLADLVLHRDGELLGWIEGFRLRRLPRQALEWMFPLPAARTSTSPRGMSTAGNVASRTWSSSSRAPSPATRGEPTVGAICSSSSRRAGRSCSRRSCA